MRCCFERTWNEVTSISLPFYSRHQIFHNVQFIYLRLFIYFFFFIYITKWKNVFSQRYVDTHTHTQEIRNRKACVNQAERSLIFPLK